MKFIKLTIYPEGYEFFVNAEYIESIATRYNLYDRPIGGANVSMNSGRNYTVNESTEYIIDEIHRQCPDRHDLSMDHALEMIYKEKENKDAEVH